MKTNLNDLNISRYPVIGKGGFGTIHWDQKEGCVIKVTRNPVHCGQTKDEYEMQSVAFESYADNLPSNLKRYVKVLRPSKFVEYSSTSAKTRYCQFSMPRIFPFPGDNLIVQAYLGMPTWNSRSDTKDEKRGLYLGWEEIVNLLRPYRVDLQEMVFVLGRMYAILFFEARLNIADVEIVLGFLKNKVNPSFFIIDFNQVRKNSRKWRSKLDQHVRNLIDEPYVPYLTPGWKFWKEGFLFQSLSLGKYEDAEKVLVSFEDEYHHEPPLPLTF